MILSCCPLSCALDDSHVGSPLPGSDGAPIRCRSSRTLAPHCCSATRRPLDVSKPRFSVNEEALTRAIRAKGDARERAHRELEHLGSAHFG